MFQIISHCTKVFCGSLQFCYEIRESMSRLDRKLESNVDISRKVTLLLKFILLALIIFLIRWKGYYLLVFTKNKETWYSKFICLFPPAGAHVWCLHPNFEGKMGFGDLSSDSGIQTLDGFLCDKSYIEG